MDGSDITIESDRKSFEVAKQPYSNEVAHSAVRGLTVTTPCGLSAGQSDLFLGKVSETQLYKEVADAGILNYLDSDVVGADKVRRATLARPTPKPKP